MFVFQISTWILYLNTTTLLLEGTSKHAHSRMHCVILADRSPLYFLLTYLLCVSCKYWHSFNICICCMCCIHYWISPSTIYVIIINKTFCMGFIHFVSAKNKAFICQPIKTSCFSHFAGFHFGWEWISSISISGFSTKWGHSFVVGPIQFVMCSNFIIIYLGGNT